MRLVTLVMAVSVVGCSDLLGFDEYADGAASSASAQGTAAGSGGAGTDASSTGVTGGAASSSGHGGSAGAAADYFSVVMADTPVAYWRFNEATASEPAQDLANEYDGTYLGGVTFGLPAVVSDKSDGAVHLDGGDGSRVEVADALDFAIRAPFAIEAWIRLDTVKLGYIAHKLTMGENSLNGYELHVDELGVTFSRWNDGAFATAELGLSVSVAEAHHVVGVYDGVDLCVYLDTASQCAADVAEIINSGVPLYLGQGLPGVLDEVVIYNSLPEDRIVAHYQAGKR